MFKNKNISNKKRKTIPINKFFALLFTITLSSTAIANATPSPNTMLDGESYEDGWVRPQECLHDETLIKARIQGADYSETMRAFLNNIQRDDTLGIGKPIKDLIHFNLDDPDKQAFNHTTSALINLALKHTNNKTGKAVGVYSDGTINNKYKGSIETISYQGHEGNPKYVYGPSKNPTRFPDVPWSPSTGIRVINSKTSGNNTALAQNLVNVLPEATLEPIIPADAYPEPNSNGIIVVNVPKEESHLGNITIQSPPKGINLLAVNYSLRHSAPYIHINQLSNYVNQHKNKIKKIIFPSNSAHTNKTEIARILGVETNKIEVPKPYENNSLNNLNPTDASAVILNDIYPTPNSDQYNTLDTIFVTKQPFTTSNFESVAWESDFLAALSLAVNKPTQKQAIILVNPVTSQDSQVDPLTPNLKNTVKKLAPGNVFISGGNKAIAMPRTEETLATLARSEKPQWLDIYSPNCKHDNPKLTLNKKLIAHENNSKVDINDNLEYEIQVTNHAESGVAKNVEIVEKAIQGLEIKNYTLNQNTETVSTTPVKITIPEIQPQETKRVIVRSTVKRSTDLLTTNMAYINTPNTGEKNSCDPNENTCSTVSVEQKTPKLKITKTLNNSKTNANVGEEVQYNITVTNIGEGKTDSAVKIFDTPVKGLINLESKNFDIGILESGESKTITVPNTINQNDEKLSENIANTCFGNSCTPKQVCETNDNTCTKSIINHNIPSLSITKTHDETMGIEKDKYVFFNITVKNIGEHIASNVVVEDLPVKNLSDIQFHKIPTGTLENNKWLITKINPQETLTATIKAKVIEESDIENQACLTANYVEKICVTDKHNDNSNIKVTKELLNTNLENNKAQYKITISNTGTTDSRNITLQDKMTVENIDKNSISKSQPYNGKYGFTKVEQGEIDTTKHLWNVGIVKPNQTITAIVEVMEATPNLNHDSKILNNVFPIDYPQCNDEKHKNECAQTIQGGIKVTKTIINENTNSKTNKIVPNQKIRFNIELENTSQSPSYNVQTIDVGGKNIENPIFVETQIGQIQNNTWVIENLPAGQKVNAIVEATTSDNSYISEQELNNTVFTSSKLFFPVGAVNNPKGEIENKNSINNFNFNKCEENNPYCSTVKLFEKSNIKIHKTLVEKGLKTYDGKYYWNIQIKNAGQMPATNLKVYEILTAQIKDIEWVDNPNIELLEPGEIKNIKVITTLANPHIMNSIVQNTAIVEADNYKPKLSNNIQINNDKNIITLNTDQITQLSCQDNENIDEDNDRCDIAKENDTSNNILSALANTGVEMKIIVSILGLILGGIIAKIIVTKLGKK